MADSLDVVYCRRFQELDRRCKFLKVFDEMVTVIEIKNNRHLQKFFLSSLIQIIRKVNLIVNMFLEGLSCSSTYKLFECKLMQFN
jgi:hypothetical protein